MDSPPRSTPPERRLPLYTPLQVRLASFFGGPFAAVYALHQNFAHLQKDRERRLTLLWGSLFCLALIAAIPFLPDKMPHTIIPLAYTFGAGQIAATTQLSSAAIVASPTYIRRSAGHVALVSLVGFVAFIAVMFPLLFALEHFGLVHLS